MDEEQIFSTSTRNNSCDTRGPESPSSTYSQIYCSNTRMTQSPIIHNTSHRSNYSRNLCWDKSFAITTSRHHLIGVTFYTILLWISLYIHDTSLQYASTHAWCLTPNRLRAFSPGKVTKSRTSSVNLQDAQSNLLMNSCNHMPERQQMTMILQTLPLYHLGNPLKKGNDLLPHSSSCHPSHLVEKNDITRRNRGCLGFHVNERSNDQPSNFNEIQSNPNDDVPITSHGRWSSKLHAGCRTSNVNFNSWNWPESMSLEECKHGYLNEVNFEGIDLQGILWPTRDKTENSTENSKFSIDLLAEHIQNDSSQLPWILSNDQIYSLTVVQLKFELGRRKLSKVGTKSILQERLKEWNHKQTGIQRHEEDDDDDDDDNDFDNNKIATEASSKSSVNSLGEWVRTVDLKPLLQRRSIIQKEKTHGKKAGNTSTSSNKHKVTSSSPLPEGYRQVLSKAFEQSSARYSNLEVKQMYNEAKIADKGGDRQKAKKILLELRNATPNDARLFRRLSRMEMEEGNVDEAISILHEGLEVNPRNPFLLHGLGQVYNQIGNQEQARINFNSAIIADPSFANSYHALGTMEHTLGRIAQAMKVLKKGLEYCPSNHRLHHAMGDLYREAKLLDMATKSYLKVLTLGPEVSHGFAYTGLAYTAYDQYDIAQSRSWLQRACSLNNGRQANAWVAWAQLEESEGNIDSARSVCLTGILQYERGLLETSLNVKLRNTALDHSAHKTDHAIIRRQLRKSAPIYRSGDRFFNVYRTWARIEERYGTIESTEDVYQRACVAFPQNWRLPLDWAKYYVEKGLHDPARVLFKKSCERASKWQRHSGPFRSFGEFEMSQGNYVAAQEVLSQGVASLVSNWKSSTDRIRIPIPHLAELLYTWAICEWYLKNHTRSHTLFHHVLKVVPLGDIDLRSLTFYALARLEIDRHEYHRAQHYIGLCLKEESSVNFRSKVWSTWADLAYTMGDMRLSKYCQFYASTARQKEEQRKITGEADILARSLAASSTARSEMIQILRREPWHSKLFGSHFQQQKSSSFFENCFDMPESKLPSTFNSQSLDRIAPESSNKTVYAMKVKLVTTTS